MCRLGESSSWMNLNLAKIYRNHPRINDYDVYALVENGIWILIWGGGATNTFGPHNHQLRPEFSTYRFLP